MCGRFTLTVSEEEWTSFFYVQTVRLKFEPRYNIAPGQDIAAIIADGSGARRAGKLRWGLVPPWADSPKIGNRMINARAETIAEKRSFREPLLRRRCLIPADSFYEWRQTGRGKQPLRIMLRSRPLFAMAGIYETWTSPDGQTIHTCSIITTEANEWMSAIHDRMPVILPREAESHWLDRSIRSLSDLLPLLKPYPDADMQAYPVHPMVGHVANDSPACIEPYAEAAATRSASQDERSWPKVMKEESDA
jgi:putative SOS response-associated peptidase YedK